MGEPRLLKVPKSQVPAQRHFQQLLPLINMPFLSLATFPIHSLGLS